MSGHRDHTTIMYRLRKIGGRWQLLLMFSIPLVWYLIFAYLPMYGLQIAFRQFNPLLGISGSPWVGMHHYERFFSSFYVWRVIGNTIAISVYSILFGFPAPIILALIVNELRNRIFKKSLQNITYIPHFLSMVVLCGMIYMFLHNQFGIINHFLEFVGIGRRGFMESPRYFRSVFVISGIWQETGWASIIYIAALAGVDTELYEAADIDGASRLRKIWHISLPGISATIVTLFILRLGAIMHVGFEKVLLLQNPLNMSTGDVIATLVFRTGILQGNFSYAAAVGLMNSVINLFTVVAANMFCRRVFKYSLW